VHRSFTVRHLSIIFLLLAAAALLLSAGSASAGAKPRQGKAILLDTYNRNLARLETNNFGIPLFLESSERDDRVQVDVYGIFDHPFINVVNVLKVPANWCDIVSLYPNIKACTYREQPGDWVLTFYLGSKVYQPPEDARQVIYHYQNVQLQPGYLDITLHAAAGPYGTKDHMMRVESLALDGGRTFVHVRYAYSDSLALRLAEKLYFATLGRDKVGFTVIGTDNNGNPVFISGPRGAVERNAVRSYFAIQTFMNTLHYPEERRFTMRINEWYDFTSHFRKQLFDLEKKDYLKFKTQENKNQLLLQRQIEPGLQ
jgi:hypothetical protein